jgi:cell division protein FtsL
MIRLNLLLLAVLIVCALGVVTSQHRARKLYGELQKEQEAAKRMDVEWGQLQLEQSTWAMHARIEKTAASQMSKRVPDAAHTQVVQPSKQDAQTAKPIQPPSIEVTPSAGVKP